ncbi:hypothetical protein MMC06_005689, partial [Schaereria dolodes]|nr:hypothetical protein [Schaereria dolodes]
MADSSNPHNYPLKRNYQAAARLNLQHYLWKEQIGYLLHPSIPLTSDDLQIADVGTGTGIFLLDLLPSVPRTAHLTGLDIDTSLCPAPAYLPKNVTLRTHDIFDEVPEDLVEKFDIIHVRFFICVVEDDDPLP